MADKCNYPDCCCPFDKTAEPNTCLLGLEGESISDTDKQFVAAVDSFRNPKVVKLEQETQALKAMVNELRVSLTALVNLKAHKDEHGKTGLYLEKQPKLWVRAGQVISKTTQQSLDTLKAEIESDTIRRCTEAAHDVEGDVDDDVICVQVAVRTIRRKYRLPTNENQIGIKGDE